MTIAELERSDPIVGRDQVAPALPSIALAAIGPDAPVAPGMVHVTEREPGPWICCAPCSGAMVAHYADPSIPATLDTAHRIRQAAGLPHAGGLSPRLLSVGLSVACGLEAIPVARDRSAIDDALAGGWSVIVPHAYGKLSTYLRRWSPRFTGGHSAVLAGRDGGSWGWWDPLAPRGWTGELVDPDVVVAAAWAGGILALAPPGGDMPIKVAGRPRLAYSVTTRGGDPEVVYYADAGGRDRLFDLAGPRVHGYLGQVGELRAVLVDTSAPYADGVKRATIVYVRAGDIGAPVAVPVDDGYDRGTADEYERWRVALGIPERRP